MRLAVIPARGGSKRIPRKNIREFYGKPIIALSIEAALSSGLFDRVVVSTDDEEIAAVARSAGAESPFMRPLGLADDYATTLDVIRHAVDWFSQNDEKPDLVCCIYATAPFLQPDDLKRGHRMLETGNADYAFSVTRFSFPIQRALRRDGEGRVSLFNPQHEATRSQDLEEAWHDAGQFYWGRADAFLDKRSIMSGNSLGVEIPRERVQDIDTEEDWRFAELLFSAMRGRNQ